ncbi:MAG: hypothetical protein ACJ76H_13275 [Bacteriovoracaceae bacterium]
MKLILFLLIPMFALAIRPEEQALMDACQKREPNGCEKLGAYYLSRMNWENALVIGEALCKRESIIGCTYAGTSLLAMKKVKEGAVYLNQACDKFEPFACRSLGRFVKEQDANLSHLYFRRACQYGLHEVCRDLSKKKELFTKMGEGFLRKLKEDCADTTTSLCQDRLKEVQSCPGPLTKEDCLLMPGYLSIWFRAKMMQIQAKLALTTILAEEKKQKNFSNDLSLVLKDFKQDEHHHYIVGFKKACAEGKKATTADLYPETYKDLNPLFKKAAAVYFAQGKKDDCYKSGLGFEAFAVGNLDAVIPGKLDVWKINHDGNLIQVSEGLP